MHPAIVRISIAKALDLNFVRRNWGVLNGSFQSERDSLAEALGCPFCAKEEDGPNYKRACEYIASVLQGDGFDVREVVEQLNKTHRESHKDDSPVAVVDDDGNIDFINGCTNGVSDILTAAAELIQ